MTVLLYRAMDPQSLAEGARLAKGCECPAPTPATIGNQFDCPWCGCGWMLSCVACRRGFVFAVAEDRGESIADLVARQAAHHAEDFPSVAPATPAEQAEIASYYEKWYRVLTPGARYVVFDDVIVPVTAPRCYVRGAYGEHRLAYVPQVAAALDQKVLRDVLCAPKYWDRARRLKQQLGGTN